MSVPRTPTALAASTNSSPASRSAPTSDGDSGIAVSATRYGTRATPGAIVNTARSAAVGTIASFCVNFTPSAISCAQPWKPPAYIGPSRPCMCAITLCSVCPTSSGSTRNATTTSRARTTTSRTSPPSDIVELRRRARPPAAGVRHARRQGLAPARCRRVCVGLARLLGAGPGLARPRGQHERLAQRRPLEAVGQQQRPQPEPGPVVEPLEGEAEHLDRLALVPRRARPHRGHAREPQVVVRYPGPQQQAPDAGGRGRTGGPTVDHVQDDVEPWRVAVRRVDGGQPVDVVHAELVAGVQRRLLPARRGDVDDRDAGGVGARRR